MGMQVRDAINPGVEVSRFNADTDTLKKLSGSTTTTMEKVKQAGGLEMDQGRGRVLQSTCSSDSFAVTSIQIPGAEGCYGETGRSYEYSTGTYDYAVGDRVVTPTSGYEVGVHAMVGFVFRTPRQVTFFVRDGRIHVELCGGSSRHSLLLYNLA